MGKPNFAQGARDIDSEAAPLMEGGLPDASAHFWSMGWKWGAAVAGTSLLLLALTAPALLPKGENVFPANSAGASTNIQGIIALSEASNESTSNASFDCDAGYNDWQNGWSHLKIQSCCATAKKGCYEFTSDYSPALVVRNFTKSSKDSHTNRFSVTIGDVVFRHEAHPSADWTRVYTHWYADTTNGWVPHWALNENITKVAKDFNHDKISEHRRDCISVNKGEAVFVGHQHEGKWSWVTKLVQNGNDIQTAEGWVPDWTLPKEGKSKV